MWWLTGTLVAAGILSLVVLNLRDQRILDAMASLVMEGRHAEVLGHPLPTPLNRRTGQAVQATSAVLTGRFAVALELLGPRRRRVRGLPTQQIDELVRAAALMGLGRYQEVTELLGDYPDVPELRRLRAQAALELGDDGLAERLLAQQTTDPMDEAGRRRLLGALRLRRGRRAEGAALVRDAQSIYAALDDAGVDVDEAYCSVLLGRAELRGGDAAQALELLSTGLDGLAKRPDNAPGLAEAHGLLAEAQAALGDPGTASRHLAMAAEQAQLCSSPALDAEVARATPMVAVRVGRREEARTRLTEALDRHEALGARPAAEELRAALAAVSD